MKSVLGSILLMAALNGAAVTAQEPPQGGSGPRMIRRALAPPPQRTGDRADVDMQMVNGMPTIVATVNGRGPYRFGVDTGAPGYLRVTPALATALGLQQVGEAMGGDPSGAGAPVRIPIYQVESLSFGGIRFNGVNTTGITLGGSLSGIDGIIGIGFFQDLLLTYDYARGRLVAAPGALPPANGADVLDATIARGLISVPIQIGSQTYPVHLDTGNTRHAFFMPETAIRSLPTRGAAHGIGVARTINREVPLQEIALAAPVRAGSTALPVTAVAFPALGGAGNIGSLALQTMVVMVDQANRRVRIVPGRR